MTPLLAPAGTTAVTWVAESTVYVAFAPLNDTERTLVNEDPVMTTLSPAIAYAGAKLITSGAGGPEITVKLIELEPGPIEFVTVMGPEAAEDGTFAVI